MRNQSRSIARLSGAIVATVLSMMFGAAIANGQNIGPGVEADAADDAVVMAGPITNLLPTSDDATSPAATMVPAATYVEQMVMLVNEFRAQNNLPPLKLSPQLVASGQTYVTRMGNANFFGHGDPDFGCNKPSDRAMTAGYVSWSNIGENIAAGFPTPQSAFDAFRNSPNHKAAMLSLNFREIGIGYFYDATDTNNVRQDGACPYTGIGGPYRYYWSQEFGSRYASGLPMFPVIINGEATSTTQQQVTLHIYGGVQGQTAWARQMRFSEDGTTWTPYENWSATKSFKLSPGNGYKTVYVQITDGASTQTVSDTIFLDDPSYIVPTYVARAFIPIATR